MAPPIIPKAESPEPLFLYNPPDAPPSPFIHSAPIDSRFRPVMENKGKDKEVAEGPRMSLAEPPVFVAPRERSLGKTRKIPSQPIEQPRRSARIAEMQQARQNPRIEFKPPTAGGILIKM
jgi:hypothetical protein